MKKILAVFLAILMLCEFALAEEQGEIVPVTFESYAQCFAEFAEAEWKMDDIEQLQVISPEDGVTVSVCLSEGDVVCISVEFPCDQFMDSVHAAIAGLGWLSDGAIEQVLALEDDALLEVDECVVYRVHGENRDAFSICRAVDSENMLWQPIHGGMKLHTKVECSGMDVSRMITEEAAQLTGWENCKRCNGEENEE